MRMILGLGNPGHRTPGAFAMSGVIELARKQRYTKVDVRPWIQAEPLTVADINLNTGFSLSSMERCP